MVVMGLKPENMYKAWLTRWLFNKMFPSFLQAAKAGHGEGLPSYPHPDLEP